MLTPWSNRQAAMHFLVLQDPDADPAALRAALDWIEASPENAAEFERVEYLWRACDGLAGNHHLIDELDLAAQGDEPVQSWIGGWHIAAGAAVIVLCLGILLLAVLAPQPSTENQHFRLASAVGETRQIRLPDDSRIVLGGASAVSVRFDHESRKVTLVDGTALFKVAHDADRPFLVETGNGSVRAIGTAFDVHRGYNGITVTVVQGKVLVTARSPRGESSRALPAGMRLVYQPNGQISRPESVDVAQAVAWQHGLLVYSGQPLASVIADLNRYSPRPIVLDGPEIGLVEVTGTVRTDGIADWLAGLASAAGLEVVDTDPTAIRIRAAQPGGAHRPAWPQDSI